MIPRGDFRALAATAFLLASIAIISPPAAAQAPEPYADTMRLVTASTAVPAPTLCQVDGGWLYTIGGGALRVVALADPVAPVVHAQLDGLGTVLDWVVSGDRAYLACGAAGLVIIDLADRANPLIAGTLALPAGAAAVALYGDLVAVAGDSVLYLAKIDRPSRPRIIEEVATIAAVDLAIVGDYALVTGTAGIATVDLARRPRPVQVALFRDDLSYYSESGLYPEFGTIVVDGDRAAVQSRQWQEYDESLGTSLAMFDYVVVLDVSAPAALANVAGSSRGSQSLLLRGDRVVIMSNANDLMAFDTETMGFRGSLHESLTVGAMAWGDRYLYAARGAALGVYDLAYPETVIPFATWGEGFAHSPASARFDMATKATYSGWYGSIEWRIYETTDALAPVVRATGSVSTSYENPGFISLVSVSGDYVLLRPTHLNDLYPMYQLFRMAAEPTTSVWLPLAAYDPVQVVLSGTTAWARTGSGTLVALDYSDFSNLRVTAQIPIPSGTLGIQDGRACLLRTSPYQMTLLDLDDPASPRVEGSVLLPNQAKYCVFSGDLAYVGCAYADLQVVDVSDPQAPVLVGSLATPLEDTGLSIVGDRAVIAGSTGFQLISLADGLHPQLLSPVVDVPLLLGCPVLHGDRVYAGTDFALNVYSATDPAQVVYLGCGSGLAGRPLDAPDWIIVGGGAYPLDASAGASAGRIVRPGEPVPARLSGAAPNPFNPKTMIRFALERPQTVEVAVYDLRGARLRTLAAGDWTSGEHAVSWDGRDDQGRALASGPYVVRLRAAGGTVLQTTKLMLLK